MGVENPDFCSFCCGLPLVGFFLTKVCNRNSLLPNWIVERTVELGRAFDPDGLRTPYRLIRNRPVGTVDLQNAHRKDDGLY